jgi:hypothetical protein
MAKRRPNSSALDAAFDRFIEAALGEGESSYPSGTTFIASDSPFLRAVMAESLTTGGSVAVVLESRAVVFVAGDLEREPVSLGAESSFARGGDSSAFFVTNLHPVVG